MENNKSKRETDHSGSGGSQGTKMQHKCPLFLGDTAPGKKLSEFLDGIAFSIFITIVTIVTLFADDFRKIFFTLNSDDNFSILTLFCMAVYSIELVTLSFVKEGYFLRFYFWLDLISTLTMILDLSWINDLLSGSGGLQTATSIVKIAKASRVSKIGARSMKLIRLLRLIRVLKLYKSASNQLQKENENEGKMDSDNRTKLNMKSDESAQKLKNGQIKPDEKENKKRESANESAQGKHQVSLKNITFEGAHRRESALHPSQKLSNKFGSIKNADDAINEFPASPLPTGEKNKKRISRLKLDKLHHRVSEEHFMVPTHTDSNTKKQSMQEGSSGSGSNFDLPHETKVSIRLKDEIQKNLISMILLILISIPVLNVDTWFDHVTVYEKSIKELEFFSKQGSTIFDAQAPNIISELVTKTSPLVYFTVPVNTTCCEFPRDYAAYQNTTKSLADMRGDETILTVNDDGTIIVVFDESYVEIFAAQLNIGLTLFVCVLLITMVIVFIHDVEVEALEPLENMINTVKKISENPLNAITEIERQNLIKLSIESGNYDSSIKTEEELVALIKEEKKKTETEPVVLENLIIKIGSLLAVGFGEAGTELIGKNIENYGSLNVMMPGKKVICIFGFCDIRNFTDATEILQAKVMLFVNEIAEICHDVVNKVGGNPNKNIGDAFLLVWKFKEEDTIAVANRHESNLELQSSLKVRQTADLAVFSFIKMIAEIARSQNLQKYKNNEKLKKRIKNYEGVKMGFGLHVGWAIEGPIGSEFKIDASYLGANVNMSGRLEAATKHYGVPMLVSGELYELMTLKNKEHLRHIDRVEVKSGEKPMDLYTVDVSIQNLIKKRGINPKKTVSALQKKKAKVHHNLNRDKLLATIQKKRVSSQIWAEDKDIQALTEPFTPDFYSEWKKGFDAYLKGDWKEAQELMTKMETLGLNGHDGPSQVILDIMKERNFEVPEGWNGTTPFAG